MIAISVSELPHRRACKKKTRDRSKFLSITTQTRSRIGASLLQLHEYIYVKVKLKSRKQTSLTEQKLEHADDVES